MASQHHYITSWIEFLMLIALIWKPGTDELDLICRRTCGNQMSCKQVKIGKQNCVMEQPRSCTFKVGDVFLFNYRNSIWNWLLAIRLLPVISGRINSQTNVLCFDSNNSKISWIAVFGLTMLLRVSFWMIENVFEYSSYRGIHQPSKTVVFFYSS